ncbi:MAG: family 2 glycosyl transferase [Planctomycetota bacterium]|nr:MAG: family 2 glycosyl transferase [Planctomycetota bacterium]
MSNLPKISVPIICSNNEGTITKVLESIKDLAFEIIVIVDHNSKDRTIEIAKEYTTNVFQEEWRGYSNQKNEALSRCTGDWILSLDSDEVVTEQLKSEILQAVQLGDKEGYFLSRRTFYIGKFMNYAWMPDARLRLAKSSANPKWDGSNVHELLLIDGEVGSLNGYLDHYSYEDINDHFSRTLKYAHDVASDRFKAGKKFFLLKLLFAPPFAFFKEYIFKRAIFDGLRGLIASASAGVYSFLKNVYLWELYENKKNKKNK